MRSNDGREKQMNNNVNKLCALITGGSRGIGRAICQRLAADGYHVIINYKSNQSEAEKTLGTILEQGGTGEIRRFDVGDREGTRAAVEQIISDLKKIDVLINNAGITADQLMVLMTAEKWDTVINTTLNGFYNTTKPVLQNMLVRKTGCIISLASVAAPNRKQRPKQLCGGQSRIDRGQ
jgi:3-oxoacyl-[acyl-carrier protein] reductase